MAKIFGDQDMRGSMALVAIVVLSALVDAQITSTYSYDAIARLFETRRDNRVTSRIDMDAAGNRVHVATSGAGGGTAACGSFQKQTPKPFVAHSKRGAGYAEDQVR